MLPKAYMEYTYIIFLIGVITIVYASLSTLRTIDIKELIAYSSVSHAAVYLLGVFSNSIQGIQGAITLGLAHGFVSPGLFICAGGVLYDRSHTRVISFYRGVTQVMPLFAILFFILCLANCGAPLTLNFIGEFLSLYGVFERSSLYGLFASSSIIFSAAYTIYMFQRIAFGGAYSRMFTVVMPDLTKREFTILMLLTVPTVILGIYPALILDGLAYGVSLLLYSSDPMAGSLVGFFTATFVLNKQDGSDSDSQDDSQNDSQDNSNGDSEDNAQEYGDLERPGDFTGGPPRYYHSGTHEYLMATGNSGNPDIDECRNANNPGNAHQLSETRPSDLQDDDQDTTRNLVECNNCEEKLNVQRDTYVNCLNCDTDVCYECFYDIFADQNNSQNIVCLLAIETPVLTILFTLYRLYKLNFFYFLSLYFKK